MDYVTKRINNFFKKESRLSPEFSRTLCGFIETAINGEKDRLYNDINSMSLTAAQKRLKALAIVTSFFADLYLSIARYADFFYRKIEYKTNIRLEEGTFHENIPSNHILFQSETDRRTAVVTLLSKNPTCHKIAVLLIKEFEIEMAKFEKDFDELGLKIYYILPKIEKEKGVYDLEDYNLKHIFQRSFRFSSVGIFTGRKKYLPGNSFKTVWTPYF